MTPGIFMDGRVFALQRHGGISRMHFELIRHLAPAFSIDLFRGLHKDAYDWGGIPLKGMAGMAWDASFRGSARLSHMLEGPWLEHCWRRAFARGFPLYHSSYYRVPRMHPGAKLIVADYDCVPERYPEICPGLGYIRGLKTRAFEHADLIVSISESSRQDVMRFYQVPGEKIRVLHLGINGFFDIPGDARPRSTGRPYVLYVGSRASYKNFDLLMQAFEAGRFPEFDLRVVGGEAPLESGRRLAGASVLHWERADDARLRELYWDAQALVYPSRYEGFGLPPLEALASGCPVVAGDTPALREVLDEHAEFFDCDQIDDLTDVVLRASAWNDKRREAAYRHARGFSWERAAARMGEYYRGLASA